MVTMSKNKIEKIYKKKKMIITHYGEDIELNEEDIKYEIYEHFNKKIFFYETQLRYQGERLEDWITIAWVLFAMFALTLLFLVSAIYILIHSAVG